MISSRASTQSGKLWNQLVNALLQEFDGAACDFGNRAEKILDDAHLLDQLLKHGRETEYLRLWDNEPHLVISKRLSRLPGASEAAEWAVSQGYPVGVRASGGTAVIHRPGVLNISYFWISSAPFKLSAGFDALCNIIKNAAQNLGIALETGKLARSYCAGTHDIGWQGRKIAGTAGVSRRHGKMHGGLFHASLVVSGDWRRDLALITQHERLSGMDARYDEAAHASLEEIVSGKATVRAA